MLKGARSDADYAYSPSAMATVTPFFFIFFRMSSAFFPTSIIQAFASGADSFVYCVQVRTTNYNCMSFSKEITVSSPLTTIVGVDGDINGDGKIGLEEAINALQCVTGLR